MKTLKEQVEEIVTQNASKHNKAVSLIKLGVAPYEIKLLLGVLPVNKAAKFNVNTLTFGVEIECYNVIQNELCTILNQSGIEIQSEGYNHASKHYYKLVSDCSIIGDLPIECVSPILKGKAGETSLKAVCNGLNTINAKVNKSTGLHVHFDASKLSDSHFVNIFKNYAKLETFIDSFMPLSRRGNNNAFCRSISAFNFGQCNSKPDIISLLNTRYMKVNAEAFLRHKTVEFRQHAGTTDFEKIINWVNFLRKLIQFSFDSSIDNVNRIEDIPFLSKKDKDYFTNRKNTLAKCV